MWWTYARFCVLLFVALNINFAVSAEEPTLEGSWLDRFEIHGHLSIAYSEATSTGLSGTLPSDAILGLSEDGSFDFRNAALQLRYEAADNHRVVVQLSHQKLGDSVLDQVNDDLELDWLFWSWQIGPKTELRFGRLPTPAGLFNEVRDVGTVLPFFRPAFNFYREGSLFSETVDGVGVTHQFFDGSPWSLEANLYAGEFEVFEQGSSVDDDFIEVDASDALGVQLWLNTPWDGVRFGVGGLRWDVAEESQFNPTETAWESWYASFEADFDRWVARVEYRVLELPFQSTIGVSGDAEVLATYWQLGWRPSDRWAVFLQSELTDIEQQSPAYIGGSFETDDRDDLGLAVNFMVRPGLVFKVEYHEQSFELATSFPVFSPEGLRIRFESEEFDNEYFIAGVAFGF